MRLVHTLPTIVLASLAAFAPAQSIAPKPDPALSIAALDREVQALYSSAQKHVVRVIVPVRYAANPAEQHPLVKWGSQIDPKVQQSLAEALRNGGKHVFVDTARSATQPAATTQAVPDSARIPLPSLVSFVNMEFAGIVLDSQGNVLLPLYVDTNAPLQVTVDDKTVTTATVVAADRLTALSVVKLAQPAGEAAPFADQKPAAGSLLMLISPTRRIARLSVWTGVAEENAILVDAHGKFSAIVRNGHALYPQTYRSVADQLVAGGPVKRAQLGVVINELGADDPIRTKLPNLGSRPAAQIQQIIPGSSAEQAGLQAGDLILSLNEDRVEDVATFAAVIANCRGKTDLHILRNGDAQTIAVDLQPK